MTDQQRDTDFAHVRVGTVICSERGYPGKIVAGQHYPVAFVNGWPLDKEAFINFQTPMQQAISEDRWIGLRFYIISQPDEAPQAPALDEAAIRDKALEDAARVCDAKADTCRKANRTLHSLACKIRQIEHEAAAAAIRQMKGAGV